ncbi:MAG TPA: MurR/RpiR family transcriptional regulator [Bryobacteraceae bacterium]|nr:MurR/RpiR family transcriptional regulator [Bryobacteraceae bacterium]
MLAGKARGNAGNGNGNLGARLANLSDRRQQIIRPVLANPRQFVLLSVRDLAKALGTDAATIVRIVRGMGFENYRAFQHHLHEASIAYATSLDTMRASAAGRNGRVRGARESIDQDLKNLSALRSSASLEQIAAIAARLRSSRRVVILGGDAATALVVFLEYTLTLLGLPVFAGTGHGRIVHLARASNKNDVVIAISFRRGLRMTVEGFELARRKGAYCVGIADTLLSPLARLADICFLAAVETPSFGVSYVAPMALLNALVKEVANARRSETLKVLREVDAEQRSGSRFYLHEPDGTA